jgi:hypothetical protein
LFEYGKPLKKSAGSRAGSVIQCTDLRIRIRIYVRDPIHCSQKKITNCSKKIFRRVVRPQFLQRGNQCEGEIVSNDDRKALVADLYTLITVVHAI